MVDTSVIKKYLSKHVWDLALKYDIPEDFIVDMPELIEMVLVSKSIDTQEEKQNWFNLLPLMNDQQLARLREILMKEKEKLQEIEQNYEKKKMEIKKKYLLKWQKMGYITQVAKIQHTEEMEKSMADEEAEKLLDLI